jgi:acyl-CoA thioester hydrolase
MAIHEFKVRRRIEFSDTDAGGIAHFARFFVFMEICEHEMLRSIGAAPGVEPLPDGRVIGWPRVAAACDYLSPVRFGDEIDVVLRVLRVGRTSLALGFLLALDGRPVARGRTTIVCAQLNAPGGLQALPIPDAVRERLAEAPPEPAAAPVLGAQASGAEP